jgi:hypothetical protein
VIRFPGKCGLQLKLKSIVVLHIGQPVKIVVAGPDRVIVAEQASIGRVEIAHGSSA